MNRQLGVSVDNIDLDFIINNDIHWIQLSNKFSHAKDITSLIKLSKSHPVKISYMSPVFHQNDPNMVFFLSPIERLRQATLDILEVNMRMAKSMPTEHVVVNLAPNREIAIDKSLVYDTLYDLNDLSHKYDLPILIQLEDYSLFEDSARLLSILDKTRIRIALDVNKFYNYIVSYKRDFQEELKGIIDYIEVINITFDVDYFLIQNVLNNVQSKIVDIPIIIKMKNTKKKKEIYDRIKNIRNNIIKDKAQ